MDEVDESATGSLTFFSPRFAFRLEGARAGRAPVDGGPGSAAPAHVGRGGTRRSKSRARHRLRRSQARGAVVTRLVPGSRAAGARHRFSTSPARSAPLRLPARKVRALGARPLTAGLGVPRPRMSGAAARAEAKAVPGTASGGARHEQHLVPGSAGGRARHRFLRCSPRQLVQRHGARHRDVQRLRLATLWDRRLRVALLQHLVRQPVALGAEHEHDLAVELELG